MITETKTTTLVKAFTKGEVYGLIEKLTNPRDKFLVIATFDGIFNKYKEYLVAAKMSDIDVTKHTIKLRHHTNGTEIEFPVSQDFIDIAIESANTYTYRTSSGNVIEFDKEIDKDTLIKASLLASDRVSNMYKARNAYMRLERIGQEFYPGTAFEQNFTHTLERSGRMAMSLNNSNGLASGGV